VLPSAEWVAFSHRLIHHGRRVCDARKPKCDACVLLELCPRIGVIETSVKSAHKKSPRKPVRKSAARPRRRTVR